MKPCIQLNDFKIYHTHTTRDTCHTSYAPFAVILKTKATNNSHFKYQSMIDFNFFFSSKINKKNIFSFLLRLRVSLLFSFARICLFVYFKINLLLSSSSLNGLAQLFNRTTTNEKFIELSVIISTEFCVFAFSDELVLCEE